jgi:hypothetical protein
MEHKWLVNKQRNDMLLSILREDFSFLFKSIVWHNVSDSGQVCYGTRLLPHVIVHFYTLSRCSQSMVKALTHGTISSLNYYWRNSHYILLSLFLLHKASLKRFVSLQFLNPIVSVEPLVRGIRPTHRLRINADKHPWLEWDSNPWPQFSSGRRYFVP